MRYTPEFEQVVRAWSKARQKEKRFKHTERVVQTAAQLAEIWSPDEVMVCRLAGWIHDAAKDLPDSDLLHLAREAGIEIREPEVDTPMLLHGAVGYVLASAEFGFEDDRIRTACTYHTTGSPDMSLTDKIVYLADLIEPGRDFPSVGEIRHLAFQVDLDQAMLFSVVHTVRYLMQHEKPIDPRMIELYNVLLKAGVRLLG
jgi:predicted HD superfamily hydrolase involved in NAD metabolism